MGRGEVDRGRRQGAKVQITPRTSRGLEKRVEGALRGELLQRGYKGCKGKKWKVRRCGCGYPGV